ncbi:HAD hydrolase-like protein [Larkinella ripae]
MKQDLLKAVIFDFDGTLADTLPLCIKAFRKAIEPHLNRPVSDDEIIATFGPSEEGTIKELIPERFDEGLTAYHSHYASFHSDVPSLFDGIPELLKDLQQRQIRLALVTGKALKSAMISLAFYQIQDVFEQVGHGDLTKGHKAKNIRRILTAWDLKPEEVVYVGDAPSDITACREAGVPVVAAAWAATAEPEQLRTLEPDALVFSVEELAHWLEERFNGFIPLTLNRLP